MAVTSYTITNISSGVVQVGHVNLAVGATANVAYKNEDVDAALTQGLISVAQVGTDAQVVLNLTAFIKELKSIPAQLVAL